MSDSDDWENAIDDAVAAVDDKPKTNKQAGEDEVDSDEERKVAAEALKKKQEEAK